MKKLDKKFLYTVMSAAATLIAATVATSACYFWIYQPEEPKSLRDE